jgi:DNA helicase-2/ATP-dependent DNA helicase PcrA
MNILQPARTIEQVNEMVDTPDRLFLSILNEPQRQAVETHEGPLLVLAGAGTGKTRVLTTRVAHILLQGKAVPAQILSVTFTNKASFEMRERVNSLIGGASEGLWLGTFHSLCVRILRRHAELVGRHASFTILDMDDQLRLIKQIIKAEGIDEKRLPPRMALYFIGRWKDRALLPEKITAAESTNIQIEGFQDDPVVRIYEIYQQRLKILNAVDFGDLILLTLQLFTQYPEILNLYQKQFKYILVDEYQDTNVAQYLWLRLLAQGANNVCCVGDDDQSIYGWRGAEVTNILRFEKDFPGAKVIRLEENYRSTPHILGAASGLIAKNKGRLGKTLWTQKDVGEKIRIKNVWDGDEEARFVGEEIESLQRKGEALSSMAILVRAAYQTREFEDRFLTLGIPYRVIGGLRFYERQEIRDALAYLRVIHQPNDSLAFERILNTPRRGIGNSTLQILHQYARSAEIPLLQAARILSETDEIRGKARSAIQALLRDIDRWQRTGQDHTPEDLAKIVLDESGYTLMWQQDKSPEAPGRLENLKEFVEALRAYESLASFLEHVSLVMENAQAADGSQDMVTLMTLHSAKGLEFDTVFLIGWEEGVFPNQRSIEEGHLEEERRLAYVGITRAKKRAIISHAVNRRVHGSWQSGIPSRFIDEIPPEHVHQENHVKVFQFHQGFGNYKKNYGSSDSYAGFKNKTDEGLTPVRYQSKEGFKAGDRVFHMKFGYGKVSAISGDKLEIRFDHSGVKNVVASFVKKADEL